MVIDPMDDNGLNRFLHILCQEISQNNFDANIIFKSFVWSDKHIACVKAHKNKIKLSEAPKYQLYFPCWS